MPAAAWTSRRGPQPRRCSSPRDTTASKIRIGHGADRDEHKVRLAREALGPGIALAADAVQGSNPAPWDADTAIEVGKRLAQYDLIWLEEPCAAYDVEAYRRCGPP